MTNATQTRKLTGGQLRRGMVIYGREIAAVRQGVGSGKPWTFVTYTDTDRHGCNTDRFRRNTVKIEVEVPAGTEATS